MEKRENPAKAFLGRYTALCERRDSLTRSIDSAIDRATKCTYTLNPIKVQGGSGAYDRMAEDIAIKLDCMSLLEGAKADTVAALQEILSAIDSVADEEQKAVLTMRYVEGLKWEDVCYKIHYEKTKVYELHGYALVKINKWLKSRSKTE